MSVLSCGVRIVGSITRKRNVQIREFDRLVNSKNCCIGNIDLKRYPYSINSYRSYTTNASMLETDNGSLPETSSSMSSSNLDLSTNILLASSPATSTAAEHVPASEVSWYDVSIYISDLIHFIHDTTGINYALSIATVTILGRCCLIPIAIWHYRNNPWQPKLNKLKHLEEKSTGPDKEVYKAELEYIQNQYPKINRYALPLASITTTIFMWLGIRRMMSLYPEELSTGGMAWFIDLTTPDPYLFLPILSNILLYCVSELDADEIGHRQSPSNRQQIIKQKQKSSPILIRYTLRILAGGILCIVFFLPSAVLCFWIPNSTLSCLQSILLSQPKVIQAFDLNTIQDPITTRSKRRKQNNNYSINEAHNVKTTFFSSLNDRNTRTSSENSSSSATQQEKYVEPPSIIIKKQRTNPQPKQRSNKRRRK